MRTNRAKQPQPRYTAGVSHLRLRLSPRLATTRRPETSRSRALSERKGRGSMTSSREISREDLVS